MHQTKISMPFNFWRSAVPFVATKGLTSFMSYVNYKPKCFQLIVFKFSPYIPWIKVQNTNPFLVPCSSGFYLLGGWICSFCKCSTQLGFQWIFFNFTKIYALGQGLDPSTFLPPIVTSMATRGPTLFVCVCVCVCVHSIEHSFQRNQTFNQFNHLLVTFVTTRGPTSFFLSP